MKNITVSVDDELYHSARVEAALRRKSLSALVRDFLAGLPRDQQAKKNDPELDRLFALSDSKHKRRKGSAGPLNREELYERGISRH